MTPDICIDLKYLLSSLRRLLDARSPAGDTERGVRATRDLAQAIEMPGLATSVTRKGDLLVHVPGRDDSYARCITAHIDTLGAVVSRIYPNGRLQLAQIGSYFWSSIENESVTIETSTGDEIRGTVLMREASYHAHLTDATIDNLNRDAAVLEVRLDALTSSPEETRALGIEVGDYAHFDTRYEESNGFIKSRYLDDKACLACALAALEAIARAGLKPAHRTVLHVGAYEEVLHGGGTIPRDVDEVLALDVGPVGEVLTSSETSVSLCILDKDGPYDRRFSLQLQKLAKAEGVELRPAIFPRFSSDAKAFWLSGGDARTAMFGPGTHATHGYERTHIRALEQTARLAAAYLLSAHEE